MTRGALSPGEPITRQLVQILDERHHRAIEALNFRTGRFDHVIFVARVRAAAVTKPEMSRREFERFAGKYIAGIRPRIPRPQERVESKSLAGGDLRCAQGCG